MQPDEVFRPRRVWQFPGGLHDYTLPARSPSDSAAREDLGSALVACEIELVVFATDVSVPLGRGGSRQFELVYPAHSTPPETMGARFWLRPRSAGSCCRSSIDGVIATDGGWVRNFPLEHAYRNPDVKAIAAFRYVASYRPTDVAFLERMRERLDRFRAVPPVRALLAEIRLAEERAARGEPAHYAEMIVRLMRVAIARNTVLEERLGDGAGDVGRDAAPAARGGDLGGGRRRARSAGEEPCGPSSRRSLQPPSSRSGTTARSRA